MTVPAGRVHHFANRGPTITRVLVETVPALDMESLLRMAAGLAQDQHQAGKRVPRLLDLALFMREFQGEVSAPWLPAVVAVFSRTVARLARLLGRDLRYRRLRGSCCRQNELPGVSAIEVRNLVKRYRGATRNAVDDVSFDAAEGELFCLLGPNGAGKTTTVSILTTTLIPTAGVVRVAGLDVVSDPSRVRREIGIVFQGPSLDRNLTAEENVRLHAVLYGLHPWRPCYRLMPCAYRRQVDELAGMLTMGDHLGQPVGRLSGGTRRKLEILRALLHHPRVLFLDEPTAGLDPETRRSLWDHLGLVRRGQGTTVCLTTHYLDEAEDADRLCVMAGGRVVELGSPAELKRRHMGTELATPRPAGPTLEDTFLQLAGRSSPMTMTAVPSRSARRELSGVLTIAQRDVTKLRRDRLRIAVNLMFPIVLMVGLGNLLEPTVGHVSGLNTVTLAFTGVLAATLYQSAAAGMISLVEDREQDFARELFVTPVSRLTLMSGKVAGETLVALCQGAGIVVAALLFGVAISLHQVALVIGPCLACCLLGASFGLATLAALPNQRSAMQVFQFLIVPQYVLSGVVVPLRGVAGWLDALGWAMPLRYGVELTRAAFYTGEPGYREVVSLGPDGDVAVMAALFLALVAGGGWLWERRERHR